MKRDLKQHSRQLLHVMNSLIENRLSVKRSVANSTFPSYCQSFLNFLFQLFAKITVYTINTLPSFANCGLCLQCFPSSIYSPVIAIKSSFFSISAFIKTCFDNETSLTYFFQASCAWVLCKSGCDDFGLEAGKYNDEQCTASKEKIKKVNNHVSEKVVPK